MSKCSRVGCDKPATEFRLCLYSEGWRTTFCWCERHSDRYRINEKIVSKSKWGRMRLLEQVHES